MYKLLETINGPEDLKKLKAEELLPLADEIRQFLLETVSATGGHLASNLGCVELTHGPALLLRLARMTRSSGTSGTRPTPTRS